MKPILAATRMALKTEWRRKWRLLGSGAAVLAAAMFFLHWEGDPHPWGSDAVIDLSDGPPKNDYPCIQIDDDAAHIRIVWFKPYSSKSLKDEVPICELDYDIRARRSSISYPQHVDILSYHWHTFGPGPSLLAKRYFAMPFPTWGIQGDLLNLSPCLLTGWNGVALSSFQEGGSSRTLAWQGVLGRPRLNPYDTAAYGLEVQEESRYAVLAPEGGSSIYLFDLVPGRSKGLAQGPKPSDTTGTHKTYLSIHK